MHVGAANRSVNSSKCWPAGVFTQPVNHAVTKTESCSRRAGLSGEFVDGMPSWRTKAGGEDGNRKKGIRRNIWSVNSRVLDSRQNALASGVTGRLCD